MKKKWFQIFRQISLFLFVIAAIYMSLFWSFKPNEAFAVMPHNLEMELLQCYDASGNFVGYGFHCTWSGDDCWYYGSSCPPDWNLN